MDERLIAVPCAGVTLMPHDARVQSSWPVCTRPWWSPRPRPAAPLQAVHRVQELRCRDIHHRINSDCQTRARRLARHANTLEGPRTLMALEDHGLADASRPTHVMAPAWGQPRRIPIL
jgi:hypothetical protein